MSREQSVELIRALEDLLDMERAALIQGQLDQLDHMLPRKEELIASVKDLQVHETEDLIRLQHKVDRNQALLKSASDGIKAVANRMAELRQVRQGLSTYDAAGQRSNYAVRHEPKLEKRA